MESSARENFYIEKITGIAIDKDNKRYYKIQWAASWEKEENLIGCAELIQQFLAEQSNEINADLQQHTTNGTKQDQVLQSVYNAIHQPQTNTITSSNDLKQEVSSSVSDDDLSQRSPNNTSIISSSSGTNDDERTLNDDIRDVNWFDGINSPDSSIPIKIESPLTQSTPRPLKRPSSYQLPSSKDILPKSKARMSGSNKTKTPSLSQTSIDVLFQKEAGKIKYQTDHEFIKCFSCKKGFKTLNCLQIHNRNSCLSPNTSPTAGCSSNNTKREWNNYFQTETSPKISKTFKCAACIKSFKNSPLLKKHIKIHRGPLSCCHCTEKFTRYHSLNLHVMNVHTDEDGALLKKEMD